MIGAVRLGLRCALAVALAACGPSGENAPSVIELAAFDLTTDDAWGWHAGVKQPLGAYQGGRSVHQVTRGGDPDNLLWVDERTGEHGAVRDPTGPAGAAVPEANPGGAVAFGPDGTIWYLTGGRAHVMPPTLFVSATPYDPRHMTVKRTAVVTEAWATSFNLTTLGDHLFLFWRNGPSRSLATSVRLRRYDAQGDFAAPTMDVALGSGTMVAGRLVGIEQVWGRADPRHRALLATWQWLDAGETARTETAHRFGSNPIVYSDDAGTTWRSVDGRVRAPLPLGYADRDAVLVPHDHLAKGEWTTWQSWDLGVAPQGTFWTAMPVGAPTGGRHEALAMFFFANGAWQRRDLVPRIPSGRKSHACATTRSAMLLVYADVEEPNVLRARVSRDEAHTWSEPVVVGVLPASRVVDWISYAQPAAAYEDDTARFFLLHHERGDPAGAFRGRARWIKLGLR